MMKRLSLKGLRLSSHPKETVHSADDGDNVATYEQPRTLSATAGPGTNQQEGGQGTGSNPSEMSRLSSGEPPGTPRRKEKKGFFKSLKSRLSGNFKGKRDSVTGVIVVEDDSSTSSEARDDGSLHCTRAPRPRRPPSHHHSELPPGTRNTPEPTGCLTGVVTPSKAAKQQQQQKHLRQPAKEGSKSEEETSTPTEEEKVENVFLTDAEYGHTSAPFTVCKGNSVTTTAGSGSIAHNLLTGAGDAVGVAAPAMTQSSVTLLVSEPASGPTMSAASELPDTTWPLTPAPLPPPSPGVDSITAAYSDSDTQGACAPRIADYSDPDQPPSHAPPPPPPTASTSGQGDGYEPYDASEQSCRGHLALIGGGIQGDPAKLLPVYVQLKEPPKSWSLTKELFKLSKFGWYWGPITRVEAEEKLLSQTDGAFLVRDSSDEHYLLSLSFRSYGRTLHTRIEHCNGVFSFYAQPESEGYYSIVDLIEHSMNDSQTGVFCYSRARTPGSPSFPVRLTKPVSRFTQVRSLQYLCRFVIRQYTRFDHIQKLPLPPRIKGWLEENQY